LTSCALWYKVSSVETSWATEHLQVIRTLMERSAVYRRALAPIMIYNGVVGLAAAALGCLLKIQTPRPFILFWGAVCVVAVLGSFLLVRLQALKDSEPLWSPPTRRVTQAFLPPLAAGLILGAVVFAKVVSAPPDLQNLMAMWWLPLVWVVLYGCAFHAAGFFLPRGMRIFGWAIILASCGLLATDIPNQARPLVYAHAVMGCFFGGVHFAAGIYLYFTEPRRNET